jgi:hypothetical protein
VIATEIVKSRGVTVEVLSTFRGHKVEVFVTDPDNAEDRAKLGVKVQEMLKDGMDLFLIDHDRITRRIKGYDQAVNDWILFSAKVPTPAKPEEGESGETAPKRRGRPRKNEERIPAAGTRVSAVARTAGG